MQPLIKPCIPFQLPPPPTHTHPGDAGPSDPGGKVRQQVVAPLGDAGEQQPCVGGTASPVTGEGSERGTPHQVAATQERLPPAEITAHPGGCPAPPLAWGQCVSRPCQMAVGGRVPPAKEDLSRQRDGVSTSSSSTLSQITLPLVLGPELASSLFASPRFSLKTPSSTWHLAACPCSTPVG